MSRSKVVAMSDINSVSDSADINSVNLPITGRRYVRFIWPDRLTSRDIESLWDQLGALRNLLEVQAKPRGGDDG